MQVLFDGRMGVSYGQAYVEPVDPDDDVDHEDDFAGQTNGLLGAAEPGVLYLTTGLHTGDVGFRLVVAEQDPGLSDEWEDVVEASFESDGPSAVVMWGEGALCEFELPSVPHRVRYCARGMDAGSDADVVMEDEPLVDHYELTFWPAEPEPDRIVRVGSKSAEYWHDARNGEKSQKRKIKAWWGEHPPSERLIDVPEARWLALHRRDLAENLAAASPGAQRAVAFWAARRSCQEAGLGQEERVAQALRLQGRNEILPPGVSSSSEVEEAQERIYEALSAVAEPDDVLVPRADAKSRALMALVGSDHEKPLLAALLALTEGALAFSQERQNEFLDEAATVLANQSKDAADPRHDPYEGDDRIREVWGNEPPHPRLREVHAFQIVAFDPALAERMAVASPETLRTIARWAARRAATAAGLTEISEVALALDHLDRSEPLPPPFDAEGGEFVLLETGEEEAAEGSITITWASDEEEEPLVFPETPVTPEEDLPKDSITIDGQENWSRPHYTLPVISQAAEPDPLGAATAALWTAACSFGDEHRRSILREGASFLVKPA